jgi:hypothetical protein
MQSKRKKTPKRPPRRAKHRTRTARKRSKSAPDATGLHEERRVNDEPRVIDEPALDEERYIGHERYVDDERSVGVEPLVNQSAATTEIDPSALSQATRDAAASERAERAERDDGSLLIDENLPSDPEPPTEQLDLLSESIHEGSLFDQPTERGRAVSPDIRADELETVRERMARERDRDQEEQRKRQHKSPRLREAASGRMSAAKRGGSPARSERS